MKLSNEYRLLISCARKVNCVEKPEEVNSLLSLQIKWDELLNISVSQAMAPLVHKSLKDSPDKDYVPQKVRDMLGEIYHGSVARNMYMRSELERILRVFNENGVEVMLLKGAALAGTVYRDIGLRLMGDIDILVRPECLDRAKEIMKELSYAADSSARSEKWYRENHFHLPPFIHESKSIIVEIHWNVTGDTSGIMVSKWWKRAGEIRVGGASALVPAPEDMILHLCLSLYHTNYIKAALRGLCDIMHTIRYFSEEIDWQVFREAVGQSGIARPVYSILFLVRKYFDSSNKALFWLDAGQTDSKFTAMVEKIIFTDSEYSALFMRSLAADTKWEKTKIILADVFPSHEKMSKQYSVRADSAKIYLYYAYRPFELAVKYGRSFLKVLCFREAG